MTRDEVEHLYYIAPIENLQSILKHGIVNHKRSRRLRHKSIADPEVQKRRARVRIPHGGPLHFYANLYFNARNPMMFKRKDLHQNLMVLRINPKVLDEDGVIIADRNAATSAVRFEPSPTGLRYVNSDYVFARDWNDNDPIVKREKKSIICAEVLVPKNVRPSYVTGIIVSCHESAHRVSETLRKMGLQLEVIEQPDLFFRSEE